MASILPVMRRRAETFDELAEAIDTVMGEDFPYDTLIERDRAEAGRRHEAARAECDRLEIAVSDLDTDYAQARNALVGELMQARHAARAASAWVEALHPGAMPAEKCTRTATAAEIDPEGKFERAYAEVAGTTAGDD